MNIERMHWGVGGAGNGKYTHTHSVPRDTQAGWSLGQGWDAIFMHVRVADPLIKLIGNEHREEAVGAGGRRQWQTQTHTHTVSLVIHKLVGAAGEDRTQS